MNFTRFYYSMKSLRSNFQFCSHTRSHAKGRPFRITVAGGAATPCAFARPGKNVMSVRIISAVTTFELGQQPAAPKATAAGGVGASESHGHGLSHRRVTHLLLFSPRRASLPAHLMLPRPVPPAAARRAAVRRPSLSVPAGEGA